MRIALFAVFTGLAFSGSALADQTLMAPNSHVQMTLPDAFKPAERFSGFVDETTGASVVVLEAPGAAWDDMKQLADAPDALATKGITEVKKVELPGRSGDYVYITGTQATASGAVGKFMLITREADRVALVSLNVPQGAAMTPDASTKAIASVALKSEMAPPLELFTLSYLGAFKQVATLMGSSKGYNLSGVLPDPNTKDRLVEPLFIVAPSLDTREITAIEQTALAGFQSIADLKDAKIISQGAKTIGGLKAYEIVGEGTDARGDRAISVMMTLVAGEKGGYFVQVGTAPKDDMSKFLPEFQKMAESFSPVVR